MTVVVVAGALANKPGKGGEAWVRLSWARGLRQLGLEVFLLEEIDSATCVDAQGAPCDVSESVNLEQFRRVARDFDLDDRAVLLTDDGRHFGAPVDVVDVATEARLLLNISGNLRRRELLARFAHRAYVDIDPYFTQAWHLDGRLGDALDRHDLHVTIAENIGSPDCGIPTAGFEWIATRQPVVFDDWPVTADGGSDRLTTVATWRSPSGTVAWNGRSAGEKAHGFRRFAELPQHVEQRLELALEIHPGDERDRRKLLEHGWRLVDPAVAGTPEAFRSYVQSSAGEFSVAQPSYVESRSGWFSDRSVRYLASGRPVLVQDTGFGRTIETGCGIVPFTTFPEAVAGARSIAQRPDDHCEAARKAAERFFDAQVVLPELLERCGVAA